MIPSAEPRRAGRGVAATVSRRASFATFGLAAVVFAVLLGAVLAGDGRPLPGDLGLHRWVVDHRESVSDGMARVVTVLGGVAVAAGVAFAGVVALVVMGRVRAVVAALVPVVVAVASFVRTEINQAVGRPRPPPADWITAPGGWAFPSGHTANATVAYGLLALVVLRAVGTGRRPGRVAGGVVAVCALAAFAVGWSRIWLGVHWPTDVVGGWAYGTAVVGLIAATGMLGPWAVPGSPGPDAAEPEPEPAREGNDG